MATCVTRRMTFMGSGFSTCSTKLQSCEDNRGSRIRGPRRVRGFPRRRPSSTGISVRTTTEVDPPLEEMIEQKFNWFKNWWPVQFTYNLGTDRPNRIQLLGEFFAVWKSSSGEWVAMKDMCPHRLAPLSEGRVEEDDTLMCSYHGWRFNECGKCVKIPQADDERAHEAACNNPRSAVKTFPCKDRGGLLWLWPDPSDNAHEDAANASLVMSDEHLDYFERQVNAGIRGGFTRVLPYTYDVLLENLLDPSHFPFAHHRVIRGLERSTGRPLVMSTASFSSPMSIMAVESPALVGPYSRLEMFGRCLIVYQSLSKDPEVSDGFNFLLATPIADGTARIFVDSISQGSLSKHSTKLSIKRTLRFHFPVLMHLYRNETLDGDNVFLHMQDITLREKDTEKSYRDRYFTPASADQLVMRYRKWLATEGGGGPFGRVRMKKTKPLSRRELLDRYKSHTLECKECQKALSVIHKLIQAFVILYRGCLLVAGAGLVRELLYGSLSKWPCALSAAAAAMFFFFVRYLRKRILPLFYFVNYIHAERN